MSRAYFNSPYSSAYSTPQPPQRHDIQEQKSPCPPDQEMWGCATCTYYNKPLAEKCCICNSPSIKITEAKMKKLAEERESLTPEERRMSAIHYWQCAVCTYGNNAMDAATCTICKAPQYTNYDEERMNLQKKKKTRRNLEHYM